jgi:hypothetical protein
MGNERRKLRKQYEELYDEFIEAEESDCARVLGDFLAKYDKARCCETIKVSEKIFFYIKFGPDAYPPDKKTRDENLNEYFDLTSIESFVESNKYQDSSVVKKDVGTIMREVLVIEQEICKSSRQARKDHDDCMEERKITDYSDLTKGLCTGEVRVASSCLLLFQVCLTMYVFLYATFKTIEEKVTSSIPSLAAKALIALVLQIKIVSKLTSVSYDGRLSSRGQTGFRACLVLGTMLMEMVMGITTVIVCLTAKGVFDTLTDCTALFIISELENIYFESFNCYWFKSFKEMKDYKRVKAESELKNLWTASSLRTTTTARYYFIAIMGIYGALLSLTAVRISGLNSSIPIQISCFKDFNNCLGFYFPSESRNVSEVIDLCLQCEDLLGEKNVTVGNITCTGNDYCDNVDGWSLLNL